MADVRVRFPLGALDLRVWESLAFRVLRAHEIAGSNPAILTDDCGGFCVGTGGRLLTALSQVRFLPPQLMRTEGQADGRRQPPRTRSSLFTMALRVRLPLL